MGSFKDLSSDFIGSRYEGGVKVILESEEDVRIFCEHWFAHYQDRLRFESAEEGGKGGGGCSAVLRKVEEARNQHLSVFGIVDRDILLSDEKPEIFWETDDEKFHEAKPYGDLICVLRRWELENYLLKPEALSSELARRVTRSPAPSVNSETLLNLEDDLVDVTALTTFMVDNQLKSPNPGFGQDHSGQELRDDIERHMNKALPGKGYNHLSENICRIKAFAENVHDPDRRWDRLTRALDGKKVLNRVCGYLRASHKIESLRYWEEMRGCLADRIASLKLIDEELVEVVKHFASTI
ncbi:MAG: hypothetical protein PHE55_02180 [Methylococcaceae bacterium]|nr:hypothetical protein [Methylococcaceae bacterium]